VEAGPRIAGPVVLLQWHAARNAPSLRAEAGPATAIEKPKFLFCAKNYKKRRQFAGGVCFLSWILETIFIDVTRDKFLKPFHIFLFLLLKTPPKILQFSITLGIGDILVITPQGIQPPAQIMDEIVVVGFCRLAVIEAFHFSVSYHAHSGPFLVLCPIAGSAPTFLKNVS
jgi:hypothetical protein